MESGGKTRGRNGMKYTKKIYRRGRNQGQLRKTAIRRKREDKEDIADAERALAEPGLNIPWEKIKKKLGIASRTELAGIRRGRSQIKQGKYVTLDELIKDKKALAKEARRQSRMLRDDPQEGEILEGLEKIADRTDWKC
jgi:hypothetical protein